MPLPLQDSLPTKVGTAGFASCHSVWFWHTSCYGKSINHFGSAFESMRLSWRPDLFVRCLSLVIFSSLTLPSFAGESLRPEKLSAIDAAISRAIADQSCPGGVIWFEHGEKSYHKAYGKRALVPAAEPMTEDTIFDLAFLTKVVACTPAIMLLVESGKVELDNPVQTYLNEFTGKGREIITVRQLLTHTSGLRPDIETKS